MFLQELSQIGKIAQKPREQTCKYCVHIFVFETF